MESRISKIISHRKENIEKIKQSLIPNLDNSVLKPVPEVIREEFDRIYKHVRTRELDEEIMKEVESPEMLYFALGLPLQQAIPFLDQKTNYITEGETNITHTKALNLDALNIHRETDCSRLYSILKYLPQSFRELIPNLFPKCSSAIHPTIKKAFVEPNLDALIEISKTNCIDASFVEKILGFLIDFKELSEQKQFDDVTIGLITEMASVLPLLAVDLDSYQVEIYNQTIHLFTSYKETGQVDVDGIIQWLYDMSRCRVKSFWYEHDEYVSEEAILIDDYLNNPYFEKFITTWREEFEKEQQQSGMPVKVDDSISPITTTKANTKKGTWLRSPKEQYYEGKLGSDIKDTIWQKLNDQVCQMKFDNIKGTSKDSQIKYTGAILLHQAAVSLGYANSLSDNAASSFERVMKFAGIKRQTLKKYEEMMEAYYIKLEEEQDDYSNDHEGTYFDKETNTIVHHGEVWRRDNGDFYARQPNLAIFLAKNFDDITAVLDSIKPKLRTLLSNYR